MRGSRSIYAGKRPLEIVQLSSKTRPVRFLFPRQLAATCLLAHARAPPPARPSPIPVHTWDVIVLLHHQTRCALGLKLVQRQPIVLDGTADLHRRGRGRVGETASA